MRLALAVLGGALVQAVAFLRLVGLGGSPLAVLVIVLTAFGTGFFAARRGALAGIASVYLGNLLFFLANVLRYGPGEDPTGLFPVLGRMIIIQLVILPFGIAGAIAGWTGERARRRLVGAWR